jgi:Na+-driven multidrug efflux pump
MDTLVGSLRGIGYSIEPMVISLSGSCAFRLLWIFTFFAGHHSLSALYVVYPISWIITAAANLIAFAILFRRFRKRVGAQE